MESFYILVYDSVYEESIVCFVLPLQLFACSSYELKCLLKLYS